MYGILKKITLFYTYMITASMAMVYPCFYLSLHHNRQIGPYLSIYLSIYLAIYLSILLSYDSYL